MKTLKSLFRFLQLKSIPECRLCLHKECRCWNGFYSMDFRTDWYLSAPLPMEEVKCKTQTSS